jgi:hypothetical protein
MICSVRAMLYAILHKMIAARLRALPTQRLHMAFMLTVMNPKTCPTRERFLDLRRFERFWARVSGLLLTPFSQTCAAMPFVARGSAQGLPA